MLDLLTISACVALVVVVAGVNFVVDSLLWRQDQPGRVWSLALTVGMGGVVGEVFWVATHLLWFVVVVDVLYVYGWMLIWSGLRVVNGKPPQYLAAAVPAAISGATALIPQPFSSTPGTFISAALICGASLLIVRETVIGRLRGKRYAHPFTFAYAAMAAYTGGLVLYGTLVPGADLRDPGFFAMGSYLIVIMLIVVIAVANATVLRAEAIIVDIDRARGVPWERLASGLLDADAFPLVAQEWLQRARRHDAELAMLVLELDDRRTIATAFGREEMLGILGNWHSIVRISAPPHARLAELSPTRLALLTPVGNEAEARACADVLRASLLESTGQFPAGFHPTMSIGLALGSAHEWNCQALIAEATTEATSVSTDGDGPSHSTVPLH